MIRGAIILCGGQSTRMGRDKASLPFGAETLLQRVIRLLSEVVPPERMVVVAAEHQVLPALPAGITATRDRRPERGPLEGMLAGLSACAPSTDAVYVTSCDVPRLVPEFVRTMFALLDDYDSVVPRDRAFLHPLAAVYRAAVRTIVEQLLATDQLRMSRLCDHVRTRIVDVESLRTSDPDLASLHNLNTHADYLAALNLASLTETNEDVSGSALTAGDLDWNVPTGG